MTRCRAKHWTGVMWRSGAWNATNGEHGVVWTFRLVCRAGHVRESWVVR